ncbi:MAG: hypothetical protein PF517_07520 [Salinivirgaceae bacterium]|jgi:hypothetical protein|nr:hypothetical protein [Salinivirgaceae bacterium]
MGVIAIGSGGSLFLEMFKHIKEKTILEYQEAVSKGDYNLWEEKFLKTIEKMYSQVADYDDGVGKDIEIYNIKA